MQQFKEGLREELPSLPALQLTVFWASPTHGLDQLEPNTQIKLEGKCVWGKVVWGRGSL
jgi:hypothetical protein